MTIGLHGPIGWPKCNKNNLFQVFLLFHFQFGSFHSDVTLVIPQHRLPPLVCLEVMMGSIEIAPQKQFFFSSITKNFKVLLFKKISKTVCKSSKYFCFCGRCINIINLCLFNIVYSEYLL